MRTAGGAEASSGQVNQYLRRASEHLEHAPITLGWLNDPGKVYL